MPTWCPQCQQHVECEGDGTLADGHCPHCASTMGLPAGCVSDAATIGWDDTPGEQASLSGLHRLGRFEIMHRLGEGAFGTVFKARDPELDRLVAIKVPRTGSLLEPRDLDRFLREARSAARLRHPGIVPVHEAGQADGVPYLVSDFVEGMTLADRLAAGRIPPREAAQLLAAIADALQYAHDQGVIHRDVKPANVMLEIVSGGVVSRGVERPAIDKSPLTNHHSPRLMDFGLAKRDTAEQAMTLEGQVLGTPAYMSPEQARGEARQVDGRTDVYSVGVVLYQMLTGELPFRGTTRMLLQQVMNDDPRRPRSLNDLIPRDLETICLKAMAKEPGRRYPSAGALADDLRRYLTGEAIRARPVGRIERSWRWCRRNPVVAGLSIGLAAVLLIGLAIVTMLFFRAEEQRHRAVEHEQAALAHLDEVNRQKVFVEESYKRARASLAEMARLRKDPRLQSGPLEDLQKQFAQAEASFYEHFVQLRSDDPQFQAERAEALGHLSSISYHLGDKNRSLRHAQEAATINEELGRRSPDDPQPQRRLAENLTRIGMILQLHGEMPQAIAAKRRAAEIYDALYRKEPGSFELLDLAVMGQQNLGVAYRAAGDFNQAIPTLEQALKQYENIQPDQVEEQRKNKWNTALMLDNLAEMYPRINRDNDAVAASQKATAILEDLYRDEPNVVRYRQLLAGNYLNAGHRLSRNQPVEAEAALSKALELFKGLATEHPVESQYRHAQAMAHDNLGLLYARTGRPTLARPHYDAAMALWEKLRSDNPTVIAYVSDLGYVQHNLGDLDQAAGKPDLALDWYGKAIATLENSPDRKRPNTNSSLWLRDARFKRANLLVLLNRHQESIPDWDRTVELEQGGRAETRLARALVLARSGMHARAMEEGEFLEKLPNTPAEAIFDLARVWALSVTAVRADVALAAEEKSRRAEECETRAIALLTQAIAVGFKDVQKLNYADLGPIKARTEYQNLIKQLSNRGK